MKNQLKQKLNRKQSCIGTWITVPSIEMVDIISSSDIDFIVIDNEHSPISLETAQLMTMVAHKNNTSAILRVSSINKSEIQKATEINVDGIQIPNVHSFADISMINEYSLYPPIGKKGLSPFTSSAKYSSADIESFITSYNDDLLLIPQLEGANVLENIDKILENNRSDIFFIGLYDLSISIGVPGNFNDPKFIKIFKLLADKILSSGFILGSIASNNVDLKFLIDNGATYITYDADCSLISKYFSEITSHFNKVKGK
jgi:4-hydroxy-2-oxoheptanedioate aldolase|tara:strand:- start:258 stop:1031 length:774 start_codon:yes stop_codon:yes gene_type:complete